MIINDPYGNQIPDWLGKYKYMFRLGVNQSVTGNGNCGNSDRG